MQDVLVGLASEDAPEALFVATRRTTLAARKRIVAELDQHFTIRRRAFVARGIRFKLHGSPKAKIRDIYAQLGTVDDFMRDHDAESPPTHRPPGAAGYRAVPIGARKHPTYVTPPQTWPGRMLRRKRGGAFLVQSKGRPMVLERTGKGADAVRVMWVLQPEGSTIEPRWPMTETVRQEVDTRFGVRFAEELDRAARRRMARGRRR